MKKSTFRLLLVIAVAVMFVHSTKVFAADMDTRIASSAKQTYVFKTYLKNDNVKVSSKDGDVTLTGTVAQESHKSLAQETVATLPGVKSVDNKLTVKGPAAGTDTWLITKVKFTLLFHQNVSAGTKVSAKNGNVTLRGKADNDAQRDLTTEYARDVEGVKSVTNEMTVANVAAKPGKTPTEKKVAAAAVAIDDSSITALVKTTLLYHRSTSALNTTVVTKDGVVTLGGKAKNAAERDLATKLVSDVQGVKSVVNIMTVG